MSAPKYRQRLLISGTSISLHTNNLYEILNTNGVYQSAEYKSFYVRSNPVYDPRLPNHSIGFDICIEVPFPDDVHLYVSPYWESKKLRAGETNFLDDRQPFVYTKVGNTRLLVLDPYVPSKPGDSIVVETPRNPNSTEPIAYHIVKLMAPPTSDKSVETIAGDPRLGYYVGNVWKFYPDAEYDAKYAALVAPDAVIDSGLGYTTLSPVAQSIYDDYVKSIKDYNKYALISEGSLQSWTCQFKIIKEERYRTYTFNFNKGTYYGKTDWLNVNLLSVTKAISTPSLFLNANGSSGFSYSSFKVSEEFKEGPSYTWSQVKAYPFVKVVPRDEDSSFIEVQYTKYTKYHYAVFLDSEDTDIIRDAAPLGTAALSLRGVLDKLVFDIVEGSVPPSAAPQPIARLSGDEPEPTIITATPVIMTSTELQATDQDVAQVASLLDVDLRVAGKSPTHQYNSGTCVANAITTGCELLLARTGESTELSRLFVYYFSRESGGLLGSNIAGTNASLALPECVAKGIPKEEDWSYNLSNVDIEPPTDVVEKAYNYRLKGYNQLGTSNDIKAALSKGFPVVLSVYMTKDANLHREAFLGKSLAEISPSEFSYLYGKGVGSIGHAMLIVGYSETSKAFIVENSYGTTWGGFGYCWLPFSEISSDAIINIYSLNGMVDVEETPPTPIEFTEVVNIVGDINIPVYSDFSDSNEYLDELKTALEVVARDVSWDIKKTIPVTYTNIQSIPVKDETSYIKRADKPIISKNLPTFENTLAYSAWVSDPERYAFSLPEFFWEDVSMTGRNAYSEPTMTLTNPPTSSDSIVEIRVWSSEATLIELLDRRIVGGPLMFFDCFRATYADGTIALYPYKNSNEEFCLIEAITEAVDPSSTTWTFGGNFTYKGVRCDSVSEEALQNKRYGGDTLPFWHGLSEDGLIKAIAASTDLVPGELAFRWDGTFSRITEGCAAGEKQGNTTEEDKDKPLYYRKSIIDYPDTRVYYRNYVTGTVNVSDFITSLRLYICSNRVYSNVNVFRYPRSIYLKSVTPILDSAGKNAYSSINIVGDGLVYQVDVQNNPNTYKAGLLVNLKGYMENAIYPNRALRFTFSDTAGVTFIHETTDPIIDIDTGMFIDKIVLEVPTPVELFNPLVSRP